MDRTLILVKPDAFERGLTGEIIARFERKGLTIVAMKHMTVDRVARRAALRRAQRAAVLRRARGVHHRRPAGGDGAGGPRGRDGRAPGDRRHQPARGRPRLDPRRLRARGADQPGARLGLGRSRPRARSASSSPSSERRGGRARPRLPLAAAAGDPRAAGHPVPGPAPPTSRSSREGDPREVVVENALRKARAVAGERVLGVDTAVVLDGRAAREARRRGRGRRPSCGGCPAATTRC